MTEIRPAVPVWLRFVPLAVLLLAAAPAGDASARLGARAARPAAPARADASDFELGADSNRTWPAGWRRGGNQPAARIELVTPGRGGGRAVRLSAPDSNGFVALVRVLPDSLRAGAVAVRFTAWMRTEDAGRATMWLRLGAPRSTIPSDDSGPLWPRGTTGWMRHEVLMPLLPEVQRVMFGFQLARGGSLWADDAVVEVLGPEQVPPSSPAARAYLEAALDSLCVRTVLTSDLNWGVLKRAARTQMLGARTPAGAYDALRYAVARLDPLGEFRPPGAASAAGAVSWPVVADDEGTIGMLRLPECTVASPAAQAALADSIRAGIARVAARQVRGWLVDLRGVTRGEVAPALAGLGPLLGDGTLLGWQRPDGRRGRWTHHRGTLECTPAAGPERRLVSGSARELDQSSLPVAVLIGPRTSTAGEGIALAFRGRAGARFFGEPTAGNGQLRERIRLRDGAELRFATGWLTDRTGRRLEGAISPDDSLDAAVDPSGQDSLTARALRWLHGTGAGSR